MSPKDWADTKRRAEQVLAGEALAALLWLVYHADNPHPFVGREDLRSAIREAIIRAAGKDRK